MAALAGIGILERQVLATCRQVKGGCERDNSRSGRGKLRLSDRGGMVDEYGGDIGVQGRIEADGLEAGGWEIKHCVTIDP